MGSRIFYSIKTHFHFVNIDFFSDHTYRVVSFFSSYSLYLFGLLSRRLFRNEESRNLCEYESNSDEVFSHSGTDQSEKQSSNRYEYLSGKDICRFVEEPTTLSFTIHESVLDSGFSVPILDTPIFDTTVKEEQNVGFDAEETEETDDFFESDMADDEVVLDKGEEQKLIDKISSDEENSVCSDGIVAADMDFGNYEFETEKTEDFVVEEKPEMGEIDDLEHEDDSLNEGELQSECDAKEESVCSNDVILDTNDSTSNGVSSIGFVDQVTESESEPEPEPLVLYEEGEDNREMETTDSDDEYITLRPKNQSSVLFEDQEETSESDEEQVCEKSDIEVEKETEYLFEHEDLIQQLKMELKLSRTGGLPTILEESESGELETPKTVVQQLKPMKIEDQKLDYKHLLEGIRKVYRNYTDKMRKLDILNFQTMHALGLLETKGAVHLERARKSSVPAIMSLLSHNLWLCKGSAVIEPMRKVIADMHREFESVYIGQLCLSWEILHWQYSKALELQNYASHCFNQVAGEFQLFQVLVQRFLENEQFQGPRIQNYVNNRCVLRSLLQVPLLRDDNSKDNGKRGNGGDEDAITSQMLPAIIQQSMKVFWDFVRADKDESNARSNLEDLVDLELLTDVQTDFQTKEKKLKDILRSGKCIVKRFKKQREEDYGMDQTLLIAQVELKLVAKVLNMSKLTADKLIWCHEKLHKINVCNRKVFVESSFLLFPC